MAWGIFGIFVYSKTSRRIEAGRRFALTNKLALIGIRSLNQSGIRYGNWQIKTFGDMFYLLTPSQA